MGSSLTVMPAASFALNLAKKATSVIVNLSPTESDGSFTYVVHEDADTFCKSVWEGMT
jgi:NAD-dependent SIR2 family protein deacetylase